MLPAQLRHELESSALLIGPGESIAAGDAELISIRRAINAECKITVTYQDGRGDETQRTIWPFALGFFDRVRVLLAWCEQARCGIGPYLCDVCAGFRRYAGPLVTTTR